MPRAGGGKALAEGEQQLWVALQPDLSCDQCHQKTFLLGKETEPGLSVGRDMYVRLANKVILNVERSILDRDGGLALLRPGECEMKGGVKAPRLVRLEHV